MWFDYLTHFLIGGIGALVGIYARNYCHHLKHQIMVGVALIALETVLAVNLVG